MAAAEREKERRTRECHQFIIDCRLSGQHARALVLRTASNPTSSGRFGGKSRPLALGASSHSFCQPLNGQVPTRSEFELTDKHIKKGWGRREKKAEQLLFSLNYQRPRVCTCVSVCEICVIKKREKTCFPTREWVLLSYNFSLTTVFMGCIFIFIFILFFLFLKIFFCLSVRFRLTHTPFAATSNDVVSMTTSLLKH